MVRVIPVPPYALFTGSKWVHQIQASAICHFWIPQNHPTVDVTLHYDAFLMYWRINTVNGKDMPWPSSHAACRPAQEYTFPHPLRCGPRPDQPRHIHTSHHRLYTVPLQHFCDSVTIVSSFAIMIIIINNNNQPAPMTMPPKRPKPQI